jgi:4-amino-4-deoxy-L-arabinose transferase-like glycosyltransferase
MNRAERPRRSRWPLVVALALTLVAGIGAVLVAEDFFSHSVSGGLSDEYDEIAINLVRHGSYSANLTDWARPTVTRGPIYPIYLGGIFLVFGERNTTAIRIFDVLLYALTVVMLVAILQRFVASLPACLGGLLYAFWPTNFYYALKGSSETMLSLWLVAALLALIRFREEPALRWALLLGVSLGLASLTRGSAIVLLFVATGWLIAAAARRRLSPRWILVVLMAWAVTMSPWWVRNYQVSGHFVPFHSLAWYNAYHDDIYDSARDWLGRTGRSRTDWGAVDPAEFPESILRHPEGFEYPASLSAREDLEQEAKYREIMLAKFEHPPYLIGKMARNVVDFWSAAASVAKSRILLVGSVVWCGLFILALWRVWRRPELRWLGLISLAMVVLTWGLYLPFLSIFRHSLPTAPFVAATIGVAIGAITANRLRSS